MRKLMIVSLALFVCYLALTVEANQSRDVEKSFRVASGKKLIIDLKTGGSLVIRGWDQDEVSVQADGNDPQIFELDISDVPEGVRIYSRHFGNRRNYSSNLKFDIKVPRRFDVAIDTMGGGVTIEGVEGEFTGKTMGGALDLANVKGTARLTTMGGNITLKNSDLDGSLKTMGGRVLFEDVTGDVKGSSMGGNVVYKNVTNRSGKSTGDEVHITTMGGAINVENAPAGASVTTMGGRIHIGSAAKFVKAKTMGGDIKIDSADGAVEATTMGGDIEVNLTGDGNVTLVSMKGDITLVVPAGLSMEIDIQLAYTQNSSRNFKISSEFDIRQEESDQWEYEHGSPRKYIYGRGSIGGGKNKIRIETINGSVYLKRG
ncbi:MAG TPA: DUF4097 family beta strand repeat-containing protein [Blastocatellia bacterium]|nr:DUF4097 family beta strand repeat-containing protein [Blastocatellia bacterium]